MVVCDPKMIILFLVVIRKNSSIDELEESIMFSQKSIRVGYTITLNGLDSSS